MSQYLGHLKISFGSTIVVEIPIYVIPIYIYLHEYF